MFVLVFLKMEKNNMKQGIYKITNLINDKFYIGSAINFTNRWNAHVWHLRNNKHINKHLQSSWNKYGENNFKFEVIDIIENSNLLIRKEQAYMNILKPNYNICKIAGSILGIKRSEETKKKMSESLKGRIISKETRDKISKTLKGRKGFLHSKETKLKLSNLKKGKLTPNLLKLIESKRKSIQLIDDSENIIKVFKSLREASVELNISQSLISRVANGERSHTHNKKFRYGH